MYYYLCATEVGGEFGEVFCCWPSNDELCNTSKLLQPEPQMANSRIRPQPSADHAVQTGRGTDLSD